MLKQEVEVFVVLESLIDLWESWVIEEIEEVSFSEDSFLLTSLYH